VVELVREVFGEASDEVGGDAVATIVALRDLEQLLLGEREQLPTVDVVDSLAARQLLGLDVSRLLPHPLHAAAR